MDKQRVAKQLVKLAQNLLAGDNTKTFPCPHCGTEVLENTSYCVKCKKKVKKDEKKASIKNRRASNRSSRRRISQGFTEDESEFVKLDPELRAIANKVIRATNGDLNKMLTVVIMALKLSGKTSEANRIFTMFKPIMKKVDRIP